MSAVLYLIARLNEGRQLATSSGRWQSALIALLAGALSALAFAPFFLSPVLLLTLPILIWLTGDNPTDPEPKPRLVLNSRMMRRGAWCGWWFGFGIHTAGLYWIGNAFLVQAEAFAWLLPFAMVLLPTGLALFHSLALAVLAVIQGPPLYRVLALSAVLAASEWLRGTIFTGFPWNILGYALTQPIELMQLASVVGIHGLTLITVLTLATPIAVLATPKLATGKQSWRPVLVRLTCFTVVPLAAMWGFGASALNKAMPAGDDSVRLIVVQPSIRQKDKFDPQKWNQIFERHLALTRTKLTELGRKKDTTDLVFWPEAAMPFLALRETSVTERIKELLPEDTYLVTGLLRAVQIEGQPQGDIKVFNSAVVYDATGKPVSIYDKHHLVPFGEYLPFQDELEAIGLEQLTRQRGGFAAGPKSGGSQELPNLGAVLFMICYEAIFPRYGFSERSRSRLLINLTNDAWFGNSSGPHQHFHQTRVRAVEQGSPLLRAANNGISGVIDARGRVVTSGRVNEVKVLISSLPGSIEPTIYSRFGNMSAALIFAILIGFLTIIGCNISTITFYRD